MCGSAVCELWVRHEMDLFESRKKHAEQGVRGGNCVVDEFSLDIHQQYCPNVLTVSLRKLLI